MPRRFFYFWIGVLTCCSCLLVLPAAQGQSQPATILFWTEGQRLSFDDFKGKPKKIDTASKETSSPGALTHKLGTIVTALDVLVRTERGKTTFTIRAAMDQRRSFIRNKDDAISLRHEQGHFDIAEIHARILRREIRKAKSLQGSEAIYNRIMEAEEKEHAAYDKANTFMLGGITDNWHQKIIKRLQALDAYTQPKVVVPIDK